MENFLISFNIIFPLFILILAGYGFRQLGWIKEEFITCANKLAFNCFLPMQLFSSIYQNDVAEAFNVKLVAYAAGSIVFLIVCSCILVPLLVQGNGRQSAIIQSIYRSNYVIFGIPIITNFYGSNQVAVIAMLIAVIIPLFNLLAVLIFAIFNKENKLSLSHIVKEVTLNPLIIATVSAVIVSLLNIKLPSVIDQTISYFANIAIPLALVSLGADFDLKAIKRRSMSLVLTTAARLVFVPAIFITISVWLGFRGVELLSLAIMYAAPVSVSSYIMAQNAKADGQLAGQVLVLTSLFSCLSIFMIIAVLNHFSLL